MNLKEKILCDRYLIKNPYTNIIEENENEMYERVAKTVSNGNIELYKNFLDILKNKKFLPAGRTLTNLGNKYIKNVVSNCVVLHIKDTLKDIFDTLSDAVMLQQSGSGVGFSFSKLRPAGEPVISTFGISSGPISFLNIYNNAFGIIKGRGRHGANLAALRIDHPDILEFIKCKKKEGKIKNFNISVTITEEFMKQAMDKDNKVNWMCVFEGKEYLPRKIKRDNEFNIIKITPIKKTAREILLYISKYIWKNGEPGIIFIDEVNNTINPLNSIEKIECCNPCGEQMLHENDACNLGSINISKFYNKKKKEINYEELEKITKLATIFLDNVIDYTTFPIKKVNDTFRKNRRIGIGIMGLADLFFKMNIRYGSNESIKISENIFKNIKKSALEQSKILGKEKGNFPNFIFSNFKNETNYMRNLATTCIAPTGTISILANVSNGLEPYFLLAYKRKDINNLENEYIIINKHLKKMFEKNNLDYSKFENEILENGSLKNIDGIPEYIKNIYVTSLDIDPKDHIDIQSSLQTYCDNSISKTINLIENKTINDVLDYVIYAYIKKCKGLTLYRNKSRDLQVLNKIEESKNKSCKEGKCDL